MPDVIKNEVMGYGYQMQLEGLFISNISLDYIQAQQSNFKGAQLNFIRFLEANLAECHFDNSAIIESMFIKCDLSSSVFSNSTLSIQAENCDFSNADFSETTASKTFHSTSSSRKAAHSN